MSIGEFSNDGKTPSKSQESAVDVTTTDRASASAPLERAPEEYALSNLRSLGIVLDITAGSTEAGPSRLDEVLTVFVADLVACIESRVESFNNTQRWADRDPQVSVSYTRIDEADEVCVALTDAGREALERARGGR